MRCNLILRIALLYAMQYNASERRRDDKMEKENFPKYYTILFNAITDAIEALRANNYGEAMDILVRGLQEAEDAYIDAEA